MKRRRSFPSALRPWPYGTVEVRYGTGEVDIIDQQPADRSAAGGHDRRVGRDDIRRQGEHDDETENGEAENGASVLAERRPERRQRRGLGEDGRRVFSNRGGERGGVSGHGESADR